MFGNALQIIFFLRLDALVGRVSRKNVVNDAAEAVQVRFRGGRILVIELWRCILRVPQALRGFAIPETLLKFAAAKVAQRQFCPSAAQKDVVRVDVPVQGSQRIELPQSCKQLLSEQNLIRASQFRRATLQVRFEVRGSLVRVGAEF